jgi:hypothetical protein
MPIALASYVIYSDMCIYCYQDNSPVPISLDAFKSLSTSLQVASFISIHPLAF